MATWPMTSGVRMTSYWGRHEISGGFRGYAGYAAAYPIDWTGCIFVTFSFCPIVWNWIFGHQLIPCVSLQLVLDQGHGTPIWRAAMHADQPVCIPCSATGGGNVLAFVDDSHDKLWAEFELWKQRWHAVAEPPKTALDAYTACNASLYLNLSILLQVLVTTRHHCHARAFLFHSQTAKDIPSVVNGRWAADVIGADPLTCANDANRTCRSRWRVCFTGPPKLNFLR